MHTIREDIDQRYKEVIIPKPISQKWAEEVSKVFRNYFKVLVTAKKR